MAALLGGCVELELGVAGGGGVGSAVAAGWLEAEGSVVRGAESVRPSTESSGERGSVTEA